MPANSDKILVAVRLPRDLYWQLADASKTSGDTKSSIIRRCLKQELRRLRKVFSGETRPSV